MTLFWARKDFQVASFLSWEIPRKAFTSRNTTVTTDNSYFVLNMCLAPGCMQLSLWSE